MHASIVVVGDSGAGKSALANAVASAGAPEGIGRAVTKDVIEYRTALGTGAIWDTPGLEVFGSLERSSALIVNVARVADAVWYCVRGDSRRIATAEIRAVLTLARRVPVVIVVTQDTDRELAAALRGFHELETLPVVSTMAKPKLRSGRVVVPSHGVPELIRTTGGVMGEWSPLPFE